MGVCAAVGSVNNTFGIKGVAEHTFFFKSIDDAHNLRRKVSECFERASLPGCTQEVYPHSGFSFSLFSFSLNDLQCRRWFMHALESCDAAGFLLQAGCLIMNESPHERMRAIILNCWGFP